MAILKIALMGNDILKRKSAAIDDPTAPEIAKLASDMIDTLADIGANGLAAPQVYEPLRMVVYRVSAQMIPEGSDMKPIDWRVLINPLVTPTTEEKNSTWERCLSVPGLHGKVERFTAVRVNATGLDGKPFEINATGFHAQLLQHECDHLDGILYPMRMTDMSTLAFNSELGDPGFQIPRGPDEFRS